MWYRALFTAVVSACLSLSLVLLPTPAQEPAQPEVQYTPFDCVKMARADAEAVAALNNPQLDIRYVRYLALWFVPKERRIKLKKALDWAVNSYNTKYRRIIRTALLPAAGDDPVVLRVNLKDYGIDPKVWDDLAENGSGRNPRPDYFFHVQAQEISTDVEYEYVPKKVTVKKKKKRLDQFGNPIMNQFGQPVTDIIEEEVEKEVRVRKEGAKHVKKFLAAAPWVALDKGESIAALMKLTNTKNPILAGHWFLTYSAWAPAYYAFIGIKGKPVVEGGNIVIKDGEREFEELAGFDAGRASKSQIAAIADSKIVTLHNRILVRFPTANGYIGGYYWRSRDTDKGTDDEDYMNTVADFDRPKFKAQEIIATALNTLQIYAVTDNKGSLLDRAVADIAVHGDQMPTKLQDKQIYTGLRNCALCHNEGMVKIQDKVRALARDKIAMFITDKLTPEQRKDEGLANKLIDAFQPELKGLIMHDNGIHVAAIKACNDLTAQENRDNNEDFIVDYYDAFITPQKAALEAGWPVGKMLEVLKRGKGIDYTLTSLIQDPPVEVSRLPWEAQGYAQLMQELLKVQAIGMKAKDEKKAYAGQVNADRRPTITTQVGSANQSPSKARRHYDQEVMDGTNANRRQWNRRPYRPATTEGKRPRVW